MFMLNIDLVFPHNDIKILCPEKTSSWKTPTETEEEEKLETKKGKKDRRSNSKS